MRRSCAAEHDPSNALIGNLKYWNWTCPVMRLIRTNYRSSYDRNGPSPIAVAFANRGIFRTQLRDGSSQGKFIKA